MPINDYLGKYGTCAQWKTEAVESNDVERIC